MLDIPREIIQNCNRTNTDLPVASQFFTQEFMNIINKSYEKIVKISQMTPLEEGATLASSQTVGILAFSTEIAVINSALNDKFFKQFYDAFVVPLVKTVGQSKTDDYLFEILSTLQHGASLECAVAQVCTLLCRESNEWQGALNAINQIKKVGFQTLISRFNKNVLTHSKKTILSPSSCKNISSTSAPVEKVNNLAVFASLSSNNTAPEKVLSLCSLPLWEQYIHSVEIANMYSRMSFLPTPETRLCDPRSALNGLFDGDGENVLEPNRSRNETIAVLVNPADDIWNLITGEAGQLESLSELENQMFLLQDINNILKNKNENRKIDRLILFRVLIGIFDEKTLDNKEKKEEFICPSLKSRTTSGRPILSDSVTIVQSQDGNEGRDFAFWRLTGNVYPEFAIQF